MRPWIDLVKRGYQVSHLSNLAKAVGRGGNSTPPAELRGNDRMLNDNHDHDHDDKMIITS